LCGKGDKSNLNIDTMNWITDKYASKTPQPNELFRNRKIRNKNCLRQPTDQNGMSNSHRGPSIDASYQVSVHMAEGFQRRRLKCEKLTDDRQQTTDGNSCLWLYAF
jgi:hypothetical protein